MQHAVVRLTLVLVCWAAALSRAASPFVPMFEEPPEEADYTALYPKLLVAVLSRNAAASLPYFLGQLEEQHYPKDRLHLFIRSDHNLDNTADLLKMWVAKVQVLYGSIDFEVEVEPTAYPDEMGPLDWSTERYRNIVSLKEEALLKARRHGFARVLFIDADQLLADAYTVSALVRAPVTTGAVIVAPLLRDVSSNYSNFWADVDAQGYYRRSDYYYQILSGDIGAGCHPVPVVHSTFIIDLTNQASQLLTFDLNNLPGAYQGPLDDVLVLAESARRGTVATCVLNDRAYGYLLPPRGDGDSLADVANSMRHLLADLVSLNDLPGLLHSPYLQPEFGQPRTFGFDKVYMINLERRPDRRAKMDFLLRGLGIEYEWIRAVDGYNLSASDLRRWGVRQLPGFLDPHHQRPMTLGEVGCFLSHYRIWQDVQDRRLNKVLVFEDDLRLNAHFAALLDALTADLAQAAPPLDWDLIYLGRKRLQADLPHVAGQRFLAPVGYTYWTLAYALSATGADKLLAARPLSRLLPVDEYLPVMYDRHPDTAWSAAFERRDLRAFTADPLLVQPAFYTFQQGYVSDTEASKLLPEEFRGDEEMEMGGELDGRTGGEQAMVKEEL